MVCQKGWSSVEIQKQPLVINFQGWKDRKSLVYSTEFSIGIVFGK